MRGAALRGLGDVKPSRRRCRRHYGFAYGLPFKSSYHPERFAYIESWPHNKYCGSIMDWKINKGDHVTEQTMVRRSLCQTWYVGNSKKHSLTLYASSAEEPPEYEDGAGERAGLIKQFYELTPGLDNDPVAVLHYDFSDLDMDDFRMKKIYGRQAYRVEFDIDVYLGDKQGVLVVKMSSGGKDIGVASIDFEKVDA